MADDLKLPSYHSLQTAKHTFSGAEAGKIDLSNLHGLMSPPTAFLVKVRAEMAALPQKLGDGTSEREEVASGSLPIHT